jgi:Secretion system C-terminal sorting domain/Metallo-peptidase family M12B Reprolysin-like
MKKIYSFVIILLLISMNLFSQNKLTFSKSNHIKIDLSKNFKNFQILKLNNQLNKISGGTSISIDYLKNYNFTLKENKLLSDKYVLSLQTKRELDRKTIYDLGFDGKYYMNQDFSKDNQFVFSTFENSFSIYIKNADSEFYIEPLSKFNKNATPSDYVFYETKDIISEELNCGNSKNESKEDYIPQLSNKNVLIGGCKTIELAMSIDYTFFAVYGSVNAAINRTLQVLNLTQANYTIANGLSDDVQFLVTEHYIVTCPATCNYWLPTLEIYDNYNSFSSNAYQMFTNPYDIKLHWQNEGGTGSIIGLGSYNMCGTSGIAVVKDYSSNINYSRCILSHEIGHNLGCVHNTEIMNAIISLSNIWSAASVTTINSSFNTLTCLSACNVSICDNKKVSNVVVSVDNPNSKINATWLAESGIDFKVRLYNSSTNTWSGYTTFSYPANATFYTFTPTYCQDNFRVEITPFCGSIKGISEQIIVQTSKNVAAPTLTFVGNPSAITCGSANRTFGVTNIDGGTTPVFQWKVNGINVGTNAPNYSSNSLITNDVLSCTITSNAACVASPIATVSATINAITPTVLSNSIVVTQSTICAGTSVTFTATGTNVVGANPYYAWYLNGQPYNSGGGPTQGGGGPTLTLIPANTGDVFTCILYDGAGCHTFSGGVTGSEGATSNAIAITIQSPCNLSNNEFELSGFSYYPNPIKNELNISQNDEISEVSLYTVLGQQVISKLINSNKTNIDVSGLSTGTYFVKIKSGENIRNLKVIKQ